ncbi:ankyrin repeat-containing protein [Heterostelium album PN500]|uniref:Ankyrin repeat-containing protein n=1 Tax=Heterostelium pallidum (strain ATCC 26659 / Pp 5 / PN500) TaxID=670386 RepID=D3BB93_HETP5|nr:ankyrin repeat-containing protein [Heterostelium album PN500]EFA81300.1 ankyrin repeat-containing protein [Heterostelium album PN500]|eukprot:XP_020433418.1 ankyrin repeat-containing protein [Heterostelium album PN500]
MSSTRRDTRHCTTQCSTALKSAPEYCWTRERTSISEQWMVAPHSSTRHRTDSKTADEKRGRTALHFAASKGNIGCVEILLKAGADPNSKDINGKTPKNLTKIPEIISVLSAYEEQKKKSKSKSKSKRNSETVEQPINKDQQTTTTTQPQINSINSSSNSSSSSNNNNNKTAEININSSNNSVSSSVVTKQKWDVNIDSNSSPTSVSMVKEESSMQSPTSSTTQSSPHSNASLSRAGSTDSLSGEKESPENTPKLDIYGFVKTTSTVDESTIRTKKTDKQEKKWAKMTKNWPKFAKSAKLRDRLPKGIPSSVRSFVWQRLVNIQEIKNKSKITYSELLQMKPQPAIASQIQRDLNRTFPKHSFFVEKGGFGQQILCNILTAFSIYNPEVGYCQGMGFITCLLIIYMAEEDAFWVLVQLAEKYGMAEMWKPDFPYLQTSFGLLNTMLEQQFPQLFAHIQKQNVFTPLFSSQWFICLLIYNLPFPVIVRIWDLFLYDGLVVIFASALALFKIYEDQIMKFEFEEILNLLKFANGEEKSLRIDVYQFMKLLVLPSFSMMSLTNENHKYLEDRSVNGVFDFFEFKKMD